MVSRTVSKSLEPLSGLFNLVIVIWKVEIIAHWDTIVAQYPVRHSSDRCCWFWFLTFAAMLWRCSYAGRLWRLYLTEISHCLKRRGDLAVSAHLCFLYCHILSFREVGENINNRSTSLLQVFKGGSVVSFAISQTLFCGLDFWQWQQCIWTLLDLMCCCCFLHDLFGIGDRATVEASCWS